MLQKLRELIVSGRLSEMLCDGQPWNTVDVTYDKPHVRRLWRQDGDDRICLHEIDPCGPEDPFFHPHPWPSAMVVVSGTYEMQVGYAEGTLAPPVASRVILSAGSCYEMADENQWHSVRPLGGPSLSVMLSGKPTGRLMPKHPSAPQQTLDAETVARLRDEFLRELVWLRRPGTSLWHAAP